MRGEGITVADENEPERDPQPEPAPEPEPGPPDIAIDWELREPQRAPDREERDG
jgi:hypothetical protein